MGGSQSASNVGRYSSGSLGSGAPTSKTDDAGYPSNNVNVIQNDLQSICNIFEVPYNMAALNSKRYYNASGAETVIVSSPRNPLSIGQLRGGYFPKICNLTYNLNSNGEGWSKSVAGDWGGGVKANSSISNVTARCRGYNIIILKFTVSFSSSNYGGSTGDGVGNENVNVITANGTRYRGKAGNNVIYMDSPAPITIEAYCYASNNWPGSPSADAVSTVIISSV
jgi:hypothetical protein